MRENIHDHPRYAHLYEQHARELLGNADFARCEGYTLKGTALIRARMAFQADIARSLMSAHRQVRHLEWALSHETIPEQHGRLRRRIEMWQKWVIRLNGWKHSERLSSFTLAKV